MQTNRGWGSLGGKPYGLQRIAFDGKDPFEIHHIAITKDGFDLVFTKPLDPKSVGTKPVSVSSFTYLYYSNYGCPEIDTRLRNRGQTAALRRRQNAVGERGGTEEGPHLRNPPGGACRC